MAFKLKTKPFSEEMKLFRYFLMIFGLLPLWSDTRKRYFSLLYTSGILLSLVLIAVSAFWINNIIDRKLNALSIIVSELLFCGVVLTNVITLIQVYSMRDNQEEIYTKFDEIDSIFQNQLAVRIEYESLRRKFYRKFALLLAALVGSMVLQCIVIVIFQNFFLYWLHMVFPIALLRLRCLQNVFYVDLINYFLTLMIGKLKAILAQHGLAEKTNLQYLIIDYKYTWRNSDRSSYDQVCVLKQMYGKLWDISNLINDCFGWSLLAIITQNFIEFTTYGYWMFLALENIIESNFAIETVLYLIPLVFFLSLLAFECHKSAENSQIIGGLVHKIERDTANDIQNALVREFSLQIIHEPICISANGFFNIDFTLLGSMAAATVTYLVILIQFQLSDVNKQQT